MPGKAKWKWQWIDCNTMPPHTPHTLQTPQRPHLPHCRRRHHDAFQLGALHYLRSLLGALLAWLPANCPCFTWLSNIMANYLPPRHAPRHHSSPLPTTTHSSVKLSACRPPVIHLTASPAAGDLMSRCQRNQFPGTPFPVAPPGSLLSHSYCQRIYFNTNFCCHSCFYCKHFFAICFDLCDGCVVPLLLPLHPLLRLLLLLLVLTHIQSSTACPARALA